MKPISVKKVFSITTTFSILIEDICGINKDVGL